MSSKFMKINEVLRHLQQKKPMSPKGSSAFCVSGDDENRREFPAATDMPQGMSGADSHAGCMAEEIHRRRRRRLDGGEEEDSQVRGQAHFASLKKRLSSSFRGNTPKSR